MSFARPLLLAALLAPLVQGCFASLERCAGREPAAGEHVECPTPGWTDRAFDLYLPPGWDGSAPLPLLIAFHGGGGNRRSALRVSCPSGDLEDPGCLSVVARRAGFAVLVPDGTGSRPLRNVRTWNAGGGHDGFNCTSGPACRQGVDDMAYLDDLLAEVGRTVPVDPRRIHATGLSNGGAISHRFACERPDRVASIAAVGGTNQWAGTGGRCADAVPVLQIHGTDDPCWSYLASTQSCLEGDDAGLKVGVAESMEGWRQRNGCGTPPTEERLPDAAPDDGTTTTALRWPGCRADLELLRVDGGGHTWPGGHQYLGKSRTGTVSKDFNASERIVEFFRAHPQP